MQRRVLPSMSVTRIVTVRLWAWAPDAAAVFAGDAGLGDASSSMCAVFSSNAA